MNNVDWNDLRFLLAVARSGSAAGAARVLGVSHATVLRRIQALEDGVGTPLFDRLHTGYVPTAAGQRFIEVGDAFERTLTGTQREVEGQTADLIGTIRFSTTDAFANLVMPEILASFRKRYPGIKVDMRITNVRLNLETREADINLRPTAAPPPSWVGRRMVRCDFGLYAKSDWLAAHRRGGLESLDWLLPDLSPSFRRLTDWLQSRIGHATIAAQLDSFLVMRHLAELGLGAALLPCFVARRSGLVLLEEVPRVFSIDVWLLTHPNLRQMGRVHAFMEHVALSMESMRAEFESQETHNS
ncbi:LysR family transcriptional regulator [Trinickia mobilis]|uniref:LysR family transcriptional regulator n=1 Tax=Trinickia mobilis TaxID=2816356 RepID=UPI001A8DFB3A|nr:LysR family transcriptional regulator [Trinickia mobilis]